MMHRYVLHALAVGVGAIVFAGPVAAQTISQDYARYSSMLNDERARTADIDRSDQARLNNGSGGSSNSGRSSSSGSSGGGYADSVGLISGTLNDMVSRHNARAADPQARDNAARAAYEERNRANAKASDDFLAAYERAHPQIQRNLEAVSKGDVNALAAAGLQYVEGRGVPQDVPKGLGLMTDAANCGDLLTQTTLARFFSDGVPGMVKAEPVQAHKWNLALAERGDTVHMTLACSEFINGRGTAADFVSAEKWCTAAMNKGDATAANNLGVMYTGTYDGVKADLPKARGFFEKSLAIEPLGKARENLTALLGGQLGGEPDYDAAFKLYQGGAAKGDVESETNLGILYINGKGTPKDDAKSVEWLTKAIKDGSTRVIYELGAMYLHGVGVPEDKARGLKMYRQAAVQGWPAALFSMGIRTMNGDDLQQDQFEGERLLHLAADNGDADAPHALGQIYLNGYGVDKDPAAARKCFQLGVERGDKECVDELKKMS